jgi:peptidyl-prolyl cis-trans isomerase C
MKIPAAILAVAILAACSKTDQKAVSPLDSPDVFALVGGEPITRADFERVRGSRAISSEAVLDELIEHRALVQTARERGYDRDPKTVAAIETMLANRVREEHREKAKAEVSDSEIEARYKADIKKYAVPAKIRAAMIFVEAPATFTEAKRAERHAAIEAARGKAASDPSQWAALAAEISYDQATKYRGGDIGWLVDGIGAEELESEVLAAAFALKAAGDLSPIITTKRGFYVVNLSEHAASRQIALSEVAPQIRVAIQREKQKTAEVQFHTTLLANHSIQARRDRLPVSSSTAQASPARSVPAGPTAK